MSNNNNDSPRTRGRSIIRSGDGKRILYDSDNDQNIRSSSTTYGGDGRILFSSKDEDKGKDKK